MKVILPVGEASPYNDLSTSHPLSWLYDSTKASLVRGWLLTAQVDVSKTRDVINGQHIYNIYFPKLNKGQFTFHIFIPSYRMV
jgi:hypothetical protein